MPLLASGADITAVEIDRDLAAALRAQAHPNLMVIEGDVLDCWDSALDASKARRIVGNLPYNISSPVLLRVLESGAAGRLDDATLMVQLEVAERLCSGTTGKVYGTLSVLAAYSGVASIALRLPPGAFRPAPEVRSAVVRFDFGKSSANDRPAVASEFRRFADFVRDVFSHRRKTLANAVRLGTHLSAQQAEAAIARSGLHGTARPETIGAADFHRLWTHVTAGSSLERT